MQKNLVKTDSENPIRVSNKNYIQTQIQVHGYFIFL